MNERDSRLDPDLEPSVGDLIESAVRKIVTGMVIAGGLIAIGLYSQAGPARYQIVAADGHFYRLNTQSGWVVGCEGDRCAILLRHGPDSEDNVPLPITPKQVTPPPQAAPAPAPQIAPPSASAPNGAPATAPAPAPATH